MSEACHCLGRLSGRELAGWYSRAAIYAAPAHYEPFGLSILEAALSGCALVLGDIESLREIWDGAAVFVSPNDREALTLALRNLMDNPGEREALAARSLERAREFTPGRMAEAYLETYQWSLEERGAACAS